MKNTLLLFTLLLTSTLTYAQKKEKPDPEFNSVYFTNRKHEQVTEVNSEEKFVYMVIETANAKGKKMKISLDENEDEFLYKKKFLGPGDSIQIKIKKDIQKLKFVIYNPAIKKHIRLKMGGKKRDIAMPEKALQ